MVRQIRLTAHTGLGSEVHIRLSEELTGTVHVLTSIGSLYLNKAELVQALDELEKEVEHGN